MLYFFQHQFICSMNVFKELTKVAAQKENKGKETNTSEWSQIMLPQHS